MFNVKKILMNDISRSYISNVNIRVNDLEKKNLTGSILIGGRNITDLAVKGSRVYKKALAFNTHKRDSVKMEPKESGDSIEDCIKYVRCKMYLEEKKPKKNESDVESEADSESNDILFDNVGGNEDIIRLNIVSHTPNECEVTGATTTKKKMIQPMTLTTMNHHHHPIMILRMYLTITFFHHFFYSFYGDLMWNQIKD